MDVGFYLGELLMQQGEVSVPGLGYFVRARISGYYDENERKFYPPYHQAQFDLNAIDDDSLAEYIAAKKNISLASAKYFLEKYIINLKQQTLTDQVPIGNLGYFYTENARLAFKPADKLIDDTIFYGLDPISISKTADVNAPEEKPEPGPIVPQESVPEIQPVLPVQEVAPPANEEDEHADLSAEFADAGEEETERRGPLRLILIILTALIAIGAGVFALYRYEPDTFAKIAFWKQETKIIDTVKPKVIKPSNTLDTTAVDSVKTDTINKDTVTKAAAAKKEPIIQPVTPANTTVAAGPKAITHRAAARIAKPSDATGTRRFEVYAAICANMAEANKVTRKLERAGLDARIVTDAPGPLIHVSVGHFSTYQEAKDFAIKVIQSGAVTGDVYPKEIIPQ